MSSTTALPKFGRPIRFASTSKPYVMGANAMVSQYVSIKNKHQKNLAKIIGSDHNAYRLYCHRDIAFIFDIQVLTAIVKTLEDAHKRAGHSSPAEGCMILFQGVRKDPDDAGSSVNFGRPTLIATAYAEKDGFLVHQPIPAKYVPDLHNFTDDSFDGIEHPGDGVSDPPPPPLSENQPPDLKSPVVRSRQDIGEETDYSIMTKINPKELDWR